MPEKTELCPSDQVLCIIAGETRLQCALWPYGLMARDLGPALPKAPEQRAELCAFQFSPGERVLMQSTSGELQARAQNNLSREILTLDRSHFVAETFALPFCSFFFLKDAHLKVCLEMVAPMHSCCSGCSQVALHLTEALPLPNISS